MKKINDMVFQNLGWKLVALVLAVILWFICMNVDNPVESKAFEKTLVLDNEQKIIENNYVLLNADELRSQRIDFRIRASKNTLAELSRKSNSIRAYVDLSPIDILTHDLGSTQSVSVSLSIPLPDSDYEITYQNPTKVDVIVDRYLSDVKSIEVDKLGEATDGFISGKSELSPSTIEVSGARTIVSQISSVRVQVDLSGATQDVIMSVSPVVYDIEGNDITEQVNLSETEINVHVPVSKYARIPISAPRITGSVADGYIVTDVILYPEYLEVVGSTEEIEKIDRIDLPAVNISEQTETRRFTFDLRSYLSSTEVDIRNGTPQEAVITVEIERESVREMQISVEKLHIVGMTSAVDLTAQTISLTVKGIEHVLDNLSEDSIYGTLNLTGLTAGTHQVPVTFTLPDEVQQIGESLIEIVIAENGSAGEGSRDEEDLVSDLEEDNPNESEEPVDTQEVNEDE